MEMIREIKHNRINIEIDNYFSKMHHIRSNFNSESFYYKTSIILYISHSFKMITIYKKSLQTLVCAELEDIFIERVNEKYNKNNYEIQLYD